MDLNFYINEIGVALWICSMVLFGLNVGLKNKKTKLGAFSSAYFFGVFAFCTAQYWQYTLYIFSGLIVFASFLKAF